jgi:hypothetical protein
MTNRESEVVCADQSSEHSSERALICACTQLTLSKSDRDRLNDLLKRGLDWQYLLTMAHRHALVPILYHQLQKCDPGLVPNAYLQKLRTSYQDNLARNLVLMDELLSIARDLRAHGIDCLPFKGPLLGMAAYGDPALRQSADLDILVLPNDIVKARDCLVASGYQVANEVNPRQERLLIHNQHNIQFVRDNHRLLVELHWRVAPRLFAFGMGADELWAHLETVKVQKVELKSWPTEELLLALCVHGARHLWERMSWICDIAGVLLRRPEVDWMQLLKHARETGCERMLLLGLCLARDFASASLPDDIEQRLKSDAVINSLVRTIAQRFFADDPSISYVQMVRDQIRLRKHWRSRTRYLRFALAPNEEDLGLKSVPPVLNFVYYGLRPWRLLIKRTGEPRTQWRDESVVVMDSRSKV